MKIWIVLLLTILKHIVCDDAVCEMSFAKSPDVPVYINVILNDDNSKIETTEILQEILDEDELMISYDVVNDMAEDGDENLVEFCSTEKDDIPLIKLLGKALGLNKTDCPIPQQNISNPASSFDCQYDFGGKDTIVFLDFQIRKDGTTVCDVSVTIIKSDNENDE